ncbi:hypothetical protein AJ79_01575 [Helicocarpus griseus UAMH5409]|uniref:Aminotransferase class I/classII large domain-containing protein n=1 Tax=Helicocarpus griseus UAMH5409 TaxID=1447875 RepID=A0A2B7Y737_9EURO|nr:hypothetical protein AJ79_01575 [Helicocarpus griseus UAMH5409]
MASAAEMFIQWFMGQQPRGHKVVNEPHFYQVLEATLDARRRKNNFVTLRERSPDAHDFASNDFLGLSKSGALRERFLQELENNKGFSLGSGGSRLLDGSNPYICELENSIARFHNAETAFLLTSGYEANVAIFGTLPGPTDVIVYDEAIHASVRVGTQHMRAATKKAFRHNDVSDFRKVLVGLKESDPAFALGYRSVMVAIETVYSMDGDIAPVQELVDVAKELFPKRNVIFAVDEAQATGVLGPRGAGLIQALGLEKEMAIRVHTHGKGLGSNGAVILASRTIRDYLINFAPGIIYTTSPSFVFLASIKAGYDMLKDGSTKHGQEKVHSLVRRFYSKLHALPSWEAAKASGIISAPTGEGYEQQKYLSQIVPLIATNNFLLCVYLQLQDYVVWPHEYPVVPKGQQRVRLQFHAYNTEEEVDEIAGILERFMRDELDALARGERIDAELYTMRALGYIDGGAGVASGAAVERANGEKGGHVTATEVEEGFVVG